MQSDLSMGVLDSIYAWLTYHELMGETIDILPVAGKIRLVPSYVLQDINKLQMEFEIKPDPKGNTTEVGYLHRLTGALWLMSVSSVSGTRFTYSQIDNDGIARTYSYKLKQGLRRARLCIDLTNRHVVLDVFYTKWCSVVVNSLPNYNFNITDTFPVIRQGSKKNSITFITTAPDPVQASCELQIQLQPTTIVYANRLAMGASALLTAAVALAPSNQPESECKNSVIYNGISYPVRFTIPPNLYEFSPVSEGLLYGTFKEIINSFDTDTKTELSKLLHPFDEYSTSYETGSCITPVFENNIDELQYDLLRLREVLQTSNRNIIKRNGVFFVGAQSQSHDDFDIDVQLKPELQKFLTRADRVDVDANMITELLTLSTLPLIPLPVKKKLASPSPFHPSSTPTTLTLVNPPTLIDQILAIQKNQENKL